MLTPLPPTLGPGAVIAHRGDRVTERENTVAAFVAARRAGASAVEFDVRRTADGALVVHHDAVVDGVGAIAETTSTQLRNQAPWLPTLDEALQACDGMWVNLEVKNSPDDLDWDPARSIASGLADHVSADGVLVSSFDWGSIEIAGGAGFATAYLINGAPLAAVERCRHSGHRAVNVRADALEGEAGLETIDAASRASLWVIAWTVNDGTVAVELRDQGVHGIITDDPGRIGAALSSA